MKTMCKYTNNNNNKLAIINMLVFLEAVVSLFGENQHLYENLARGNFIFQLTRTQIQTNGTTRTSSSQSFLLGLSYLGLIPS